MQDTETNQPWTIGPTGSALTVEGLPQPGERWTAMKKATVVAALRGDLISSEDVLSAYNLTVEELSSWQRGFERFGVPGLRMTTSQKVRDKIIRDLSY